MYIVYSKTHCPFCDKAKALLDLNHLDYEVRWLDQGQAKVEGTKYYTKEELLQVNPTARSVPQILINGTLIGGYTDLEKHLAAK